MSSRLETLLAAVKTRLESIDLNSGYTYTVVSVQRWQHEWDGEEVLTNTFRDLPVILIRTLGGDMAEDSPDLVTEEFRFDLQFLLGDSANDDDKVAALADMKKALFSSFDGWGVGATLPKLSWYVVDVESGAPVDGVHATVTIIYQHDLGDPATRTG